MRIHLLVIFTFVVLILIQNIVAAESEWKIQKVVRDGQIFKVPYKITNGNVEKIQHTGGEIILEISNEGSGVMEITMPRNLIDSRIIDPLVTKDDDFFVVIDGHETRYEETNTTRCFRTLSIDFLASAKKIEIISTGPASGLLHTSILPIYVTTDRSNYEHGQTIAISGCTNLALHYDQVTLNIVNPNGETYDIVSATPNIDGTFSYSFQPQGTLGIDGNYTVNASYGDNTSSHTFVVPEFPVSGLIIFASAIFLTMIASRIILKNKLALIR